MHAAVPRAAISRRATGIRSKDLIGMVAPFSAWSMARTTWLFHLAAACPQPPRGLLKKAPVGEL